MGMNGFYSAERQVAVVGMLAFCGPGMFNALNGLGGAGSGSASVAALANGSLYFTFAISGYFGGAAFNLFGPVVLFMVGGLTYAIYATCIYFTEDFAFLAVVGGAILGVGAGLFWTAQGSLIMAYATPKSRGKMIGLFWVLFNLGGVMGGLLEFALNYNSSKDSADPLSYFTFIGIMLFGSCLAPIVLAKPAKVVKEDGSPVFFEKARSAGEEIRATLAAANDPFVRRMALFFLASNWFYTYDFSGFNGTQFSIRTRGLNSAIFWAAQMAASYLLGRVLDNTDDSVRTRARKGLTLTVVSLVVSLGPAILDNFTGAFGMCGKVWDKNSPCELDFLHDAPRVAAPMVIYALMGASDAVYQSYAYWLMSSAARGSVRKTVQFSAAYKGIQSLGGGLAWLADLSDSFSYRAQGIVALGITLVACLPVKNTFKYLSECEGGDNDDLHEDLQDPLNADCRESDYQRP
uniref:Major facilitator superfamily (MFS) profile domain-containing protein n=1 Tax=Octactis speculum TaxID=3111310 RepID=A0A7S2CVS6_9STRA|mmetsp:Transcript_40594/g.55262  ORF Transcript_40594/g.55262 Transcript_40594/m.55262 type:complete len:462 (+) Transcript_40594:62-1447(+)